VLGQMRECFCFFVKVKVNRVKIILYWVFKGIIGILKQVFPPFSTQLINLGYFASILKVSLDKSKPIWKVTK
jgi:hypothetical protein